MQKAMCDFAKQSFNYLPPPNPSSVEHFNKNI